MPVRAAPEPAHGPAAELRRLREARGLGLREAARRLGRSASSLSRTENGLRTPAVEELTALLDLYEVTGAARERLLRLAAEPERRGWWDAGSGSPVPPQLATLIGLEARAVRIVEVQLVLIPGLLQTAEYARALLRAAGLRGADIETRVALRLGRQAILTRPDPLDYLVLLDEAALHRPVGGPHVFARQLRQLAEQARRPNVAVEVIPFGCGAHAALTGAHLILEFAEAPPVVHLEHPRSPLFLDRPDDVRPFLADVDTLRFTALDRAASAALIAERADAFERTLTASTDRPPEGKGVAGRWAVDG